MGHSYVSSLFHCVFSTKGREPHMNDDLQGRLWSYVGGIARKNNMKAIEIGGVEDHLHLLLSLPGTIEVSKAMRLLKGGSSKWVHDEFPSLKQFEWQEGYGAFSIGISQVEDTIAYIRNQKEHHKRRDFKEEFVAFLKAHGIEYDERYIWE